MAAGVLSCRGQEWFPQAAKGAGAQSGPLFPREQLGTGQTREQVNMGEVTAQGASGTLP